MYLKNELARKSGRAYAKIAIPENEAYLTDAELGLFGEQLEKLNAQYAEAASTCLADGIRIPARREPLRSARAQRQTRAASCVPMLRQWFATML